MLIGIYTLIGSLVLWHLVSVYHSILDVIQNYIIDLPPKVVPMTKLVSPIKHWPPEGEVLPPVPEVKNLMNYAV